MSSYERDEYEKLRLVLAAAKANMAVTGGQKITISTAGHNPSASITVEAYVLEQFIKEEYDG